MSKTTLAQDYNSEAYEMAVNWPSEFLGQQVELNKNSGKYKKISNIVQRSKDGGVSGKPFENSQFTSDLNNPLYIQTAKLLGIENLNSSNDLAQVIKYLTDKPQHQKEESQPAPAAEPAQAAPAAAAPAPAAPKQAEAAQSFLSNVINQATAAAPAAVAQAQNTVNSQLGKAANGWNSVWGSSDQGTGGGSDGSGGGGSGNGWTQLGGWGGSASGGSTAVNNTGNSSNTNSNTIGSTAVQVAGDVSGDGSFFNSSGWNNGNSGTIQNSNTLATGGSSPSQTSSFVGSGSKTGEGSGPMSFKDFANEYSLKTTSGQKLAGSQLAWMNA